MDIKRRDVNALEPKLEQFAENLPEQERNVLTWILARAKAATEVEVSESELDTVSGGLSDAAGFEAAEKDSISVSGTWTRG
jgi:hypothetical protein